MRFIHVVACASRSFLLLSYVEFYEYSQIYLSIFLLTDIQVVSSLGPIANKAGMKINNVGLSIKRTQNKC